MRELDCLLWCPKCLLERGRLFRIPAEGQGVYENVTEPDGLGKKCVECGTDLVRK